MKGLGLMAMVAGAILLSVGTAGAIDITTADGNGADTYVQNRWLDDNHSVEHDMIGWDWWYEDEGRMLWYKMYFRFDVSSLTLPLTTNFKLTCATGDGQFPRGTSVWGLNDGDPGESWVEEELTWNNAPANDTTSYALLSNATSLGDFNTPRLQYPDPDAMGGTGDLCGDALNDFVNADTDGLVTFIILSPGETGEGDTYHNGFVFLVTKENTKYAHPTLTTDAGVCVAGPGDLNEDGFVGQLDLDIVLAMWGNGPIIPDGRADVNMDDFVGQTDLDYVLGGWGLGTPPTAPVPEPATLGLLAIGATMVLRRRR